MTSIFNTTFKGVEIACETGDITQAQYGAIVVSTDTSFSLNAGAGNAVLCVGGLAFQQNLNQSRFQMNGGNNNILVVQAAGNLRANTVILVALRGHHRPYMESLYRDVIQEAIRLNVGTVAIPAIGCGAYGYPLHAAAEHARNAIQNCANFGNLTKICFMDLSGYSLREFRDKLSALIPHGNLPQPPTHAGLSAANNLNQPNLTFNLPTYIMPNFPLNQATTALAANHLYSLQNGNLNVNTSQAAQLLPTTSNGGATNSSVVGPSPPKKRKTANKKTSKIKDEEDNENDVPYTVIERSDLPKPSESELASNKDDPYHMCSICLSDMEAIVDSQGDPQHDDPPVQLKKCSHFFHKSCIEAAFKCKAQCPNCLTWYAPAKGNQPLGGSMNVTVVQNGWNLGFLDAQGYIQIYYSIPGGIQTHEHPRPGVRFSGTHRTAYLPNNREGNEVLRLLQLAFDRRLIFTVGDSITSGQKNTAVWNNVHHKTSLGGGAQSYGYPDEDYLRRVKEELAAVGIRAEMLNNDGSSS